MAEPFKNVFNLKSVRHLSRTLASQSESFDEEGFFAHATESLNELELKARSEQIVQALRTFLPDEFPAAASILKNALSDETADTEDWTMENTEKHESGVSGWLVMPLTEFVGRFGQDHFNVAMDLFHAMTQRFSAEFGIRHFLHNMPEKTLTQMLNWTTDRSVHVRRLASEGTRPTLPWGIKLPAFLANPMLTKPILEALKDDPEEYVRRSVANHLNDLSKQHPEWVAQLASEWKKQASPARLKLIRHACRTLFKQGHPGVLALFGFNPPKFTEAKTTIHNTCIEFGTEVTFQFSARATGTKEQNWMVDYIVHHTRANGTLSPKVFKWKTVKVQPNQLITWQKHHPLKAVTTRKYYNGEHRITPVVNGVEMEQVIFNLKGA